MGGLVDLTGQRFGKLVVIERVDNAKDGTAQWLCQCDCGNVSVCYGTKLRNRHIQSCGCLKRSRNGKRKTRLYRIWTTMKARCEKKTKDNYKFYGGRGITVCEEWQDFECFEKWAVANGYQDNLSLDRKNPNQNYMPSNCRWITIQEQQNNRRDNVILTYKGKTYTKAQLARALGYKYHTVDNRLRLGWTTEEIANAPERKTDNR